ncbi:unnamed protein product [Microthlaspi erraticum]|uniref:Uncharacterized protein n=1 Tax=Microthlaspi erraticum TaxID=1685480 RepID=A0A6D2KQQ7_9BRAS|nr:unnamed protein product [Microthlaspi erraticum]
MATSTVRITDGICPIFSPGSRRAHSLDFSHSEDFLRPDGGDGGPPRWFSPLECGKRAPGSPLLLYIPVTDRTPARDVVKLIERTGEEYKLFWPEHSEFVRIASKFGAKIIPFGTVGEDDLSSLSSTQNLLDRVVLDYNDQMKIPFLKKLTEEVTKDTTRLRNGEEGEVGNQDLPMPGIIPKIPRRFYVYFGKPIETKDHFVYNVNVNRKIIGWKSLTDFWVEAEDLLRSDGGDGGCLTYGAFTFQTVIQRLPARGGWGRSGDHLVSLAENFRSLSSYYFVTGHSLKVLALSFSSSLEELSLLSCDAVERKSGSVLVALNKSCVKLRNLDVASCRLIEGDDVEAFVMKSQRLKKIVVDESKITEEAMKWASCKLIEVVAVVSDIPR